MSEGFLLRVKYAKRGRLAYLSHLETVRSMERVIRRAQLPYAITEGFNPHMKVAFGPALPVGAGSESEYLDLRMKDYVPAEEALARMQAVSAPNLRPLGCAYIGLRDDAITVAYPVSCWEAEYAAVGQGSCEDLRAALGRGLQALLEQGHITVVRKRKKPKQVDFEGRLLAEPVLEEHAGRVLVRFATRDWGEGALRPDKFLDAAEALAAQPDAAAFRRTCLTRTALLSDDAFRASGNGRPE